MEEELDPGIDATDSGSDLLELDPPPLPKWITKVVIRPSTCLDRRRPRIGDEASIRCKSEWHKSGAPIHSSVGDSVEVIALGDGGIHEAWSYCLATMQRGEAARFVVIPPKQALAAPVTPTPGEQASTADRLAHALPLAQEAVALEIEMLDWVSFVSITEDGSLSKRILTQPDDRRKAAIGQVCLLSYSLRIGTSNAVTQEIQDLQYVLMGSQRSIDRGPSGTCERVDTPLLKSEVLDEAIKSMRRGEVAEVQCTSDYGLRAGWFSEACSERPAEEKVTCRLQLREFLETEDVSFAKDGSIMKTSLTSRDSWRKCSDAAWCKLRVQASAEAEEVDTVLEFVIGNGIVCDSIEAVAVHIRVSEVADIVCKQGYEATISVNGKDHLLTSFRVQVVEYRLGPLDATPADTAKLKYVEERREVAADLFSAGRHLLAAERYKACIELLGYVDDFGNLRMGKDRKALVEDLKIRCALSRSLCCFRSGHYREALLAAQSVLEEQPHNVKGLYRRAQARLSLLELDAAEQDVKAVLQLQPNSTEARSLLREILAQQKQANRLAKPLCEQMCSALGTLPHPLDVD